jgi:hypothetical protein
MKFRFIDQAKTEPPHTVSAKFWALARAAILPGKTAQQVIGSARTW